MKKYIIIIIILLFFTATIFSGCLNDNKDIKPSPIKVILDCDMGYMNDDALSLSMLLKAEERGLVKIMGITLEGGNNFIDANYENYGEIQYSSSQNTEEFLKKVNRLDINYYRGYDFPIGKDINNILELDKFYKGLKYIKVNSDYGAIHFFNKIDPKLLSSNTSAADFLISSVKDNPGEIVIITIGPSMNVANAVLNDPAFASNVKEIYYMGGALGEPCVMENIFSEQVIGIKGANVTPFTEYNVLYDPKAFEICITAAFPKQYILPGSCNVEINQSVIDKFISLENKSQLIHLWADYYKSYVQDYPYWDPLTVYALLNPQAINKASIEYVFVNTDENSDEFGRTSSYTKDEYEKLKPDEQLKCGKAKVIYEMKDFWDYTLNLLA